MALPNPGFPILILLLYLPLSLSIDCSIGVFPKVVGGSSDYTYVMQIDAHVPTDAMVAGGYSYAQELLSGVSGSRTYRPIIILY